MTREEAIAYLVAELHVHERAVEDAEAALLVLRAKRWSGWWPFRWLLDRAAANVAESRRLLTSSRERIEFMCKVKADMERINRRGGYGQR